MLMNVPEETLSHIKRDYSRLTGKYTYSNGSKTVQWRKLPWNVTYKLQMLAFAAGAMILVAAAVLGILRSGVALSISPTLVMAARNRKALVRWRRKPSLRTIPDAEKKRVRKILSAAVAGNSRAQTYASTILGVPEDTIVDIGRDVLDNKKLWASSSKPNAVLRILMFVLKALAPGNPPETPPFFHVHKLS